MGKATDSERVKELREAWPKASKGAIERIISFERELVAAREELIRVAIAYGADDLTGERLEKLLEHAGCSAAPKLTCSACAKNAKTEYLIDRSRRPANWAEREHSPR